MIGLRLHLSCQPGKGLKLLVEWRLGMFFNWVVHGFSTLQLQVNWLAIELHLGFGG